MSDIGGISKCKGGTHEKKEARPRPVKECTKSRCQVFTTKIKSCDVTKKNSLETKPTWKNECDLCATCRAISTSTESSCALRRSWASRPVVSTSRNSNKIIRFLYYFWGKCVVVPAEGIPCPWRWGRWRRRSQGGSGQSRGPGKKVKK